MKNKILILSVFFSSLLIVGCSSDIVKNTYETEEDYLEKINKICANKDELIISTNDSLIYSGKQLVIKNNSVTFIDNQTEKDKEIDIKDLAQIKFEGTGTNVFEGFLFGGLAGGLLSAVFYPDGHEMSGLGVILGTGIGMVVGGVVGFISSSKTIIYFSK